MSDQQQPSNTGIVLLIAAAVVFGAFQFGIVKVKGTDAPAAPTVPAVVLPTFPADVQSALATIKQLASANPAAAKQLGHGYRELGWVIGREESAAKVKTTGDLRNVVGAFERQFIARTKMQNSVPGAAAQMNAAMLSHLGKEDTTLDRAKAAALLEAIAQALGA